MRPCDTSYFTRESHPSTVHPTGWQVVQRARHWECRSRPPEKSPRASQERQHRGRYRQGGAPPERGRFPVHICPTLFADLALVGNRHIDRLPDNTIASVWRRRTKSSRPNIYERAASTTLDETEWHRPLKFPSIHGPRPAGSGYLALWLLARRPFCYPNLYRPRRRNPDKAAHCPYRHPASP
jgi:hypothetical protein